MNDNINAIFVAISGILILLSAVKVAKNKSAAGVSPLTVAFFVAFGVWNLWFYSSLNQVGSMAAQTVNCTANIAWLALILIYRRRDSGFQAHPASSAANLLREIEAEYERAVALHPTHHSLHESLGIIWEEFEEFKVEVFKKQPDRSNTRRELLQVAAMCIRTAVDAKL
jgi:hypothetical protein